MESWLSEKPHIAGTRHYHFNSSVSEPNLAQNETAKGYHVPPPFNTNQGSQENQGNPKKPKEAIVFLDMPWIPFEGPQIYL